MRYVHWAYYLIWAMAIAFLSTFAELWQVSVSIFLMASLVVVTHLIAMGKVSAHLKTIHRSAEEIVKQSQTQIAALESELHKRS